MSRAAPGAQIGMDDFSPPSPDAARLLTVAARFTERTPPRSRADKATNALSRDFAMTDAVVRTLPPGASKRAAVWITTALGFACGLPCSLLVGSVSDVALQCRRRLRHDRRAVVDPGYSTRSNSYGRQPSIGWLPPFINTVGPPPRSWMALLPSSSRCACSA